MPPPIRVVRIHSFACSPFVTYSRGEAYFGSPVSLFPGAAKRLSGRHVRGAASVTNHLMIGRTQTPSLLEAASGDLVVRIWGASPESRIVRLRSQKCTIGSDPTCTLRIRARGVGPVHCVIVRGGGRAVIRRQASDTRLNGQDFGDAALLTGDRFSVGPLELEVLDTGVSPPTRPARPTSDLNDHRPIREQRPSHGTARELADQRRRWEAEIESLRGQLEAQRAEHEAGQKTAAERRSELDRLASELDARTRDLDARHAELEARQEELGKRQEEADLGCSQLDVQQAELQARQAEIESLRGQLEAQRAEHEAGQKTAAERRSELDHLASELDARTRDLDSRHAELEARQEELGKRQEEADLGCSQLDVQQAELQARQAEIESLRGQ